MALLVDVVIMGLRLPQTRLFKLFAFPPTRPRVVQCSAVVGRGQTGMSSSLVEVGGKKDTN